jgi:hypothetical protein
MKITLPEGFQPPENLKPGTPFEVVATMTMSDDGTYDLTAIDGVELPESEEDEGEEDEMEVELQLPWAESAPMA